MGIPHFVDSLIRRQTFCWFHLLVILKLLSVFIPSVKLKKNVINYEEVENERENINYLGE